VERRRLRPRAAVELKFNAQFTAPHQTRHDSPVCVVSGVNWTIALNVSRLQILCRRQSGVVGNPVRTVEADATQTRQFCRVWRDGGVTRLAKVQNPRLE